MKRMYIVASIAIVAILILGMLARFSNHSVPKTILSDITQNSDDTTTGETFWNAFSLRGTLFIYPANWEFSEDYVIEKEKSVANAFSISNTDQAGVNHKISVRYGCGTPGQVIQGECIKGFLLSASDQSEITNLVYSRMKAFLENPDQMP